MDPDRIKGLTEQIIGCAFRVAFSRGNALAHELRKLGLKVQQQVPLKVWYDDIIVGEYIADLLIEDIVLVELKAAQGIDPIHSAICLYY